MKPVPSDTPNQVPFSPGRFRSLRNDKEMAHANRILVEVLITPSFEVAKPKGSHGWYDLLPTSQGADEVAVLLDFATRIARDTHI